VSDAKSLSSVPTASAPPGSITWAKFLDQYGTRRSGSGFWLVSDFFNSAYRKHDPINAGILDLSLYTND
jgi:hypothetical protein